MRWKHQCPKCGGTDIIKVPGRSGAYGTGNNISVGLSIFSAVMVHRYVCCSCGFTEEWVDREDVETLRKKFGN